MLNGRYSFEEHNSYLETVFATPLLSPTRQTFYYADPPVHVLVQLLEQVVQTDLLTFATEHLFGPLSIATDAQSRFLWEKTPDGRYYGAGRIHFKPQDMAKFGYLYLHGGFWQGQ